MVHPRDGKWSWFVCLSAAFSWFAALGFVFSFGIFFPVFMDYFQESREKTASYEEFCRRIPYTAGVAIGGIT
ncbi:hypothetical protein P5673_021544 [Acropora cervicornis]|uniref:Uncharacterized protein n=1 Tax=Acropora cervicornis TaxID=6130 RepID=A0AAD9V063_ACRCE|nr:hypothetical protein P5673_021544 [Acropora cervicornis]